MYCVSTSLNRTYLANGKSNWCNDGNFHTFLPICAFDKWNISRNVKVVWAMQTCQGD